MMESLDVNIEGEKIYGEITELLEELNVGSNELTKNISQKSLSKDIRPIEVKVSIKGKIDKLNRQKEIIQMQLSDPEGFTYDKYMEYIEKNNDEYENYSSVSYYYGSHLNDDLLDFDDSDKVCNYITLESIDDNIDQLNESLKLDHLKKHIKIPPFAISKSKIKSKIDRSMNKIINRYIGDESKQTVRSMSVDLYSLQDSLYQLAPSSINKHNKFIYAFCKYTDKFFDEKPFLIIETINNIKNLEFGDRLDQNEVFIENLNQLYDSI